MLSSEARAEVERIATEAAERAAIGGVDSQQALEAVVRRVLDRQPARGFQLAGPYDTGVLAAPGVDLDGNVTVTHGLGLRTAANQIAVGNLYDGNFAALMSWRSVPVDEDSIQIFIGNPSGRATAQAGLKFFVVAY